MSLINDALKQAQQAPPRIPQRPLAPLPPDDDDSGSRKMWLIPAIVILLVCAVVFVIGLASAHHSVKNTVEIVTAETVATQTVAEVPAQIVTPPPPPTPVVVDPDNGPKLQGIFYSAKSPTAIIDGKTVRVGDRFQNYRVKEITRYTVLLVGPDNKPLKLGMAN
jgi:hypothetical protein